MGSKYDRQIGIVNTLLSGQRIHCQALAAEFEVSAKTIKQDIFELSLFYPIETYQGRGGGIEISKGYILNGYIMKRKYLDLIFDALTLFQKTNPDPDIVILIGYLSKK